MADHAEPAAIVDEYRRAKSQDRKGAIVEAFLDTCPGAGIVAQAWSDLLEEETSPPLLAALLRLASIRRIDVDTDTLLRLVMHRDIGVSGAAGEAAVHAGVAGEEALIRAVESMPRRKVPYTLSLLGDLGGARSAVALARVAERPDASDDMRWTALGALARRREGTATPTMLHCLQHGSSAVKVAAVRALAVTGDETAAESVVDYLQKILTRRIKPADDHPLRAPLVYLCRQRVHHTTAFSRTTEILRKYWDNVSRAEQKWITVKLPELVDTPTTHLIDAANAERLDVLTEGFILPTFDLSPDLSNVGWVFLNT